MRFYRFFSRVILFLGQCVRRQALTSLLTKHNVFIRFYLMTLIAKDKIIANEYIMFLLIKV